ncbi:hypothetical protein GCM10017567_31290 [Amycolatopsis bullii]|uniref:Uncharacterized protein n=1 Tax=Amycolatopsis bullii TaxID=941987 RepID=A0ABQ3KEW0_9PSEU|nr:hypothetical protein GCM10017567_31290 [Amycolatopsis bullii]
MREPFTRFGHFARFEQAGHFGPFGGEAASAEHNPRGRGSEQEAREGTSPRRRLKRDTEADGRGCAQRCVRGSARLRINPQTVFQTSRGGTEQGDRMARSGVTEQSVGCVSGHESGRSCP